MDFEVSETEEKDRFEKRIDDKIKMVVIIAAALIAGFFFFFISNALFGKKENKNISTEVTLDLNSENVQILYSYVTYGVNNIRNDKFVKESKVTIDSFSNQEKLYYAFQFAQAKDFSKTDNYDSSNRKIYYLSQNTIREYMERFFGGNVSFSTGEKMTYSFRFKIY